MLISRVWLRTAFAIVAGLCLSANASAAMTYNDTTGDGYPGTNPDADLASVTVSNDASNITFLINVNPSATLLSDNYTQYELGLQMNGGAGGQTAINGTYGPSAPTTGNPYGNAVGISTGENYSIDTYLGGSGYSGAAEFFQYSSTSGWPSVASPNITETNTSIQFSYPMSELGLSIGSSFNFDVWTTFGGGGQSAYDALDNPNNLSSIANYYPYFNSSVAGTPTPYDSATAPGSTFSTTIYTVTAVPEPVSATALATVIAIGFLKRRRV